MFVSTLAAALVAAQPQPAPPAPAMDHSKMDHGKMDHSKMGADAKPMAKMDCCKDGCACCAKMKDKPAA